MDRVINGWALDHEYAWFGPALMDHHSFDHWIFLAFSAFSQGREAPPKAVNP
jgi:hypothetical protein